MKKQPAAPSLPGMEQATPTDHPPALAESKCYVCGYPIGTRHETAWDDGKLRHEDCKKPAWKPEAGDDPRTAPAEHHPLAGALAATFGRDEPAAKFPGNGVKDVIVAVCFVCGMPVYKNDSVLDSGRIRHSQCELPPIAEQPVPKKKAKRETDPMLRSVAKLDRLLAEMKPGMQRWAVMWLSEKYGGQS
jgi:hypothetical protein